MKNSNYNTRQHFESLLAQERERAIPQVNVRAAVRQALTGEMETASFDSEDTLAIIVSWFSGIRGWIATGLALASVAALAVIAMNQVDTLLEDNTANPESDQVAVFIDSGDWSELL